MSLLATFGIKSIVSGIGKVIIKQLGKMVIAAASEKFVEYAMWVILDEAAKSTKTKVDDEFLAKLKEAYEDKKKQG